jgi:4-aminobutyrate aminotransferase-like enzyme
MVREAGGLCIADEVQTGLGRVGAYYWAFQIHDVVPDIVTIGKPLGNGHPIAAVACTRAVADAFSNGMEYFNTFGGNPVSCAAGSAVLRVVDNENLMFEAGVKGEYWKSGLKSLQSTYPIIGDVRGSGLFLGFELVRNDTLEPATDEAKYLINRMRQMGVLTSTDGPHNNVIKIKPPLCISRGNIDLFLDRLECILREDQMRV